MSRKWVVVPRFEATVAESMTVAAAGYDPVTSRDDMVVMEAAAWLSGWLVGWLVGRRNGTEQNN